MRFKQSLSFRMDMVFIVLLILINSIEIPVQEPFYERENQEIQSDITPQYIADQITKGKEFLPNHPDSAIQITERLFLYKEMEQNDSLYAEAKYVSGTAYYFKDFYNLSIQNYEEALSTEYAQSDKSFRVRILNNIGVGYDNLRQHRDALHYYILALEIEKERGDPVEMADMYINIGLVYYAIGDYQEALENFNTARELIEGFPTGYTLGLIQQNLGIVYHAMGNKEESKAATLKAIDIFDEHEIYRSKIQSLYNLAIDYIENDRDLGSAKTIIAEATVEAEQHNLMVQRAQLSIQLGRIMLMENDPETALVNFKSAESTLRSLEEPYTSYPLELYENKIQAYAMLGMKEGVMDAFGEYKEIREERELAEQRTAINELKLQLEVNENLAKMQEQTIELQNQKAKTKTFSFMASILAVLLFGSLYFIKYRDEKLKKLYEVNKRALKKHRRVNLFLDKRNNEKQEGEHAGGIEDRSGDEEKTGYKEAKVKESERGEKPERAEYWVYKKVNDLVDEESLHKDSNLTLSALSAKAGVSSRAVSESINYYSGLSFNHFINEFRVIDAMKFLEDQTKNHLSLESIMEDSGFASRSTFYSAFDKVSGMTPSQYRKISQREKSMS